MERRVAIFVDGENVSSAHAETITRTASTRGATVIARVYGDVARLNGWREQKNFTLMHSGTGKNATDVHLALDALELAIDSRFSACLIASSDRDFRHLATKLRERGIVVIGMGETKAHATFRDQCSEFEVLETKSKAMSSGPPTPHRPAETVDIGLCAKSSPQNKNLPTKLDDDIRSVVLAHEIEAKGMQTGKLNEHLRKITNVKISTRPERTWRKYCEARPHLYIVEKKDGGVWVRIRPQGFE